MNKLKRLENLNKTLKPPQEISGLFLPDDSKKQFDFMFVAEMPSKNKPKNWDGVSNYNFNVTKRDKFLQKIMRYNHVDGSYVTDIVKEINIPRKPKPDEIKERLPHLLKEIKIIQPKAIIVLGKRTYVSFRRFVEPLIPKEVLVDYVFHYSQQGAKTNTEVEQRFSEVINKMKSNLKLI